MLLFDPEVGFSEILKAKDALASMDRRPCQGKIAALTGNDALIYPGDPLLGRNSGGLSRQGTGVHSIPSARIENRTNW